MSSKLSTGLTTQASSILIQILSVHYIMWLAIELGTKAGLEKEESYGYTQNLIVTRL